MGTTCQQVISYNTIDFEQANINNVGMDENHRQNILFQMCLK